MTALKDYPFIYTRPVVWGDIDGLGHVNNIRYYEYAQEARVLHINAVLPDTFYTVIVATSCQYMSEVFYPDVIKVGVRVKHIGTTSFTHEFAYYSTAQDKIVAVSDSVVVLMDKATKQKTAITDEVRSVIANLNNTA